MPGSRSASGGKICGVCWDLEPMTVNSRCLSKRFMSWRTSRACCGACHSETALYGCIFGIAKSSRPDFRSSSAKSCASLDNLIWELLRPAGHSPRNPSAIEFPILSARPTTPDKLALFNRKIEGVGNQASALIESLQPYNDVSKWEGPHHSLLILHDMNRFDKHRE